MKTNWKNIRGQEFTNEEANQASDFADVLVSFGIEGGSYYDLFKGENLALGHRLVLAEFASLVELPMLLLLDVDERLKNIMLDRLNRVGGGCL